MEVSRLENLVVQVLEETRAFRQEISVRFDRVEGRLDRVEQDVALLKLAVVDTSATVRRIEAKLDNHEARITKLEDAAE